LRLMNIRTELKKQNNITLDTKEKVQEYLAKL